MVKNNQKYFFNSHKKVKLIKVKNTIRFAKKIYKYRIEKEVDSFGKNIVLDMMKSYLSYKKARGKNPYAYRIIGIGFWNKKETEYDHDFYNEQEALKSAKLKRIQSEYHEFRLIKKPNKQSKKGRALIRERTNNETTNIRN